jgi:hypothetical protein
MYNKEKYILEKLITRAELRSIIEHHNWFIAGGACTSVFSGASVNDLDIYFLSEADYQSAVNKVMPTLKDDYFATGCAFSFKKNGIKIQYIKKIVGSGEYILSKFDFTICECAYLIKTQEFIMSSDFLPDLCARRLRYNISGEYPIASLWRTKKYIERGFKLPAIESIKLSLRINNLKIDSYKNLKEQLEGIDTLFLKDLTDILIENGEKKFDLNEALAYMEQVLENKLNLMEEETEDV